MDFVDAINFGITIGLGVLSLGVSILSVILSIYFARQSDRALENVKVLTNEIKMLTHESVNNQQKYSDKMLDSIIQHSNYGKPVIQDQEKSFDETLQMLTKEIKEDLENKINIKLDAINKKSVIPTDIRTGINKSIKESKINISEIKQKFEFPEKVKCALEYYKKLPAFFILLRAIVLSGAKNAKELNEQKKDYPIPDGWEDNAIDDLARNGLLTLTDLGFKIPEELVIPYRLWIDKNKDAFQKLLKIYSNKSKDNITNDELIVAENEIQI
jgi:hypothetical protein